MFKNIILLASLCLLAFACAPQSKDPIVIGMGLPLTGTQSMNGLFTKRGVELALEEVNVAGGIHGRPLKVDLQDDQGDPKQAVAVAQKFIANPQVLLASEVLIGPSMSVAPLYQRANLPFCGFFVFHPDFTKIGNYIWNSSPSMKKWVIYHANYVKRLGLKRVAFFSVNNEFGKVYGDLMREALNKEEIHVVVDESYLHDEKDFRPLISKAKNAQADGFVLTSYLVDRSLIIKQIHDQGLQNKPIVCNGLFATGKFPQMAGDAAEGTFIAGDFFSDDPRPEVVNFKKKWQDKYPSEEVEYYSIRAYDAVILMAEILKISDESRSSVNQAFAKVKDVPSVLYGKVTFDPTSRSTNPFLGAQLVIRDGKVIRWAEGK